MITCRPLANTVELLDLHGFKYTVVGQALRRPAVGQAVWFPVRVYQLCRFLSGKKIDVAISQSSFHSPVVARLMGIRSIYMNDNEHAAGKSPRSCLPTASWVPSFSAWKNSRSSGPSAQGPALSGRQGRIYLWGAGSAPRRKNRTARDRARAARGVYPSGTMDCPVLQGQPQLP